MKRMMRYKNHSSRASPHDDFLMKVVTGILIYWLALTVAVLTLNAFGKEVSDALVAGAFGAGGLELLASSYIKVKKFIEKVQEDNNEN